MCVCMLLSSTGMMVMHAEEEGAHKWLNTEVQGKEWGCEDAHGSQLVTEIRDISWRSKTDGTSVSSWLLALYVLYVPSRTDFLQFLSPSLAFEFPITKIGHPPHFLSPVFVSVLEMGPCCVVQTNFKLLGSRVPLSPSLPCSWAYRCALDILFSSLLHPGLSWWRITPVVKFPVYQNLLGVYGFLSSLISCSGVASPLTLPLCAVSSSPNLLSSCRNSCPSLFAYFQIELVDLC